MSVVVLGMDYPSSCSGCEFCYDYIRCRALGFNFYRDLDGAEFDLFSGRLQNCPLRPLPKKHGRLIDADVLESGLKTLYKIGDIEPIQWTYFRVTLKEQKSVIEEEGEVV